MKPGEARYNTYSIGVGNAFLQSVADTWSTNNDGGWGHGPLDRSH
jgi:hypothetical protein